MQVTCAHDYMYKHNIIVNYCKLTVSKGNIADPIYNIESLLLYFVIKFAKQVMIPSSPHSRSLDIIKKKESNNNV